MQHHANHSPRRVTRRALLSLAALAAGTSALSPWHLPRHASASGPEPEAPTASLPSATVPPAPGPPPLAHRDPLLTVPLSRAGYTRGAISRFEGAFPSLNIKKVLALPGLGSADLPWMAVSIVGPVHQLQVVDPAADAPVHVISIPGSHNGGIGSMVWAAGRKTLYLTTGGTLLSWNPANPALVTAIGPVPGATALYDLQLDSTGTLWGGTYPNGAAFSLPASGRGITVHRRVADDTDYVRRLAVDANDTVFVGTGSRDPRLYSFPASDPDRQTRIELPSPMPTGFISSIDVRGDRVVVTASNTTAELLLDPDTGSWAGELERVWSARASSPTAPGSTVFYSVTRGVLYATDTSNWSDTAIGQVDRAAPLALFLAGNQVLVASQQPTGMQLEFFDPATGSSTKKHLVTLVAGEFKIQSLMGHSDGNIYIGGYMGSGVAAVNPDTGARWRSPDDVNLVNQIEGMIEFDAARSYIGSYGSADIVSMDGADKDSELGYHRLERLSTKYHQSRPFGWAVNSTNAFFGTVPDYGRAGGVLGMVNPVRNKIAWVLDGGGAGFIKAQSIIGLAADERFVYGTSSVRNGYGLPDTKAPAQVFKLEIATRKVIWQGAPVADAGALYSPVLIGGWLVVADIEGVIVIDPENGKTVARHRLTTARNAAQRAGWANADLVPAGDGSRMVHSAAGTTTLLDFRAGTTAVIGSPGTADQFGSRLASTPEGRVFGYTEKTVLVELDVSPRPATKGKRPVPAPTPRPRA